VLGAEADNVKGKEKPQATRSTGEKELLTRIFHRFPILTGLLQFTRGVSGDDVVFKRLVGRFVFVEFKNVVQIL
jgi:hypothetical protein